MNIFKESLELMSSYYPELCIGIGLLLLAFLLTDFLKELSNEYAIKKERRGRLNSMLFSEVDEDWLDIIEQNKASKESLNKVSKRRWTKDELIVICYMIKYKNYNILKDDTIILSLMWLFNRSKSSIETKISRLYKMSKDINTISILDKKVYYEIDMIPKGVSLAKVCKAVEDTGRGDGFVNTYIL